MSTDDDASPSAASAPLVRSLLPLVFLSGASCLVYEIVWVRAAGLQFGTTTAAITTVVAAFMLGLALGNRLFGNRADRHPRPLLLYRRLELGIGLSGLLVSLLLLKGQVFLSLCAVWVAGSGSLAHVLRFFVVFLLLLVPTTLMGGTLPVLSRALVHAGREANRVGTLYAVNTAGAVLGALAPDLLLVPGLGLSATVGLAALGNLCVAGLVGRLSPREPAAVAGPQLDSRPPLWALALYGVSGFACMGVEIVWSRLIAHWSADRITSFSVLLAVYLLFLALGARLAARRADGSPHPLQTAALINAATGFTIFLAVALAGVAPGLVERALARVTAAYARVPLYVDLLNALWHALYLAALPSLLMGAALPYLAAATVRPGQVGRSTGRLYSVNVIAGVAGAVLAGFVFLPGLGAQRTLFLLAAVTASTGALVALGQPGRMRTRVATVAGVAGLLVLGLVLPADHLRHNYFPVDAARIEVIKEGATTTAAVTTGLWAGEPAFRELRTPGVSMSSTRASSRRYMALMGHLPLLFSRDRSEAALICYGAGNTARALLAHPDLRRLDVIEIAREAIALSPYFGQGIGDPLLDARTHVFIDDGRQHLVTTHQRYDAITSEPPPPNSAGVVNLYSREYYAVAKRTLKAGGVLAQWLPVYQMSAAEIRTVVAAFTAEFSSTALFEGYGYQWILLGSTAPLTVDLPAWQARAGLATVKRELDAIGIDGVPDLLATFLLDDAGLRRVADDVEPLTDDRPSIQYPRHALRGLELPDGIAGPVEGVLGLLGGRTLADDAGFAAALRASFAAATVVRTALPLAWIAAPEERELAFGTRLAQALTYRTGQGYIFELLRVGDDRVPPALASTRKGRNDPAARLTLARRAFYARDWAAALEQLDRLRPEAAGFRLYFLLRGGAERALGRPEAARASFAKATPGGSPAFVAALSRLSAVSDRIPAAGSSPLQTEP